MFQFTKNSCNDDTCGYSVLPGLTYDKLKNDNKLLFINLTNAFCPLRKAIEIITTERNNLAHALQLRLDEASFERLWNDVSAAIERISSATNTLNDVRKNIRDIKEQHFDVKLCLHKLENMLREIQNMQSIDEPSSQVMVSVSTFFVDTEILTCEDVDELQDVSGAIEKLVEDLKETDKRLSQLEKKVDQNTKATEKVYALLERIFIEGNVLNQSQIETTTRDSTAAMTPSVMNAVWTSASNAIGWCLSTAREMLYKKDEAEDSFKCGPCQSEFNRIQDFLAHEDVCVRRKKSKKCTSAAKDKYLKVTVTGIGENWEKQTVEYSKENIHRLHVDGAEVLCGELGSLIVWIKSSATSLTSRSGVVSLVNSFLKNLLRTCHVEENKASPVQVNVEIFEEIPDVNEEGDIYRCGQCNYECSSFISFLRNKTDKCQTNQEKRNLNEDIVPVSHILAEDASFPNEDYLPARLKLKGQEGLSRELMQLDKQSANVFINLLKEDSYPMFELRSMLQGEQGTGKSTIARFLVGKRPTLFRTSTDGIGLYTGLSFFDDDTEKWLVGKQGFALEDITVSRLIKDFKKEGHLFQLQEETTMEMSEKKYIQTDYFAEGNYKEIGLTPPSLEKADKDILKKQGLAPQSSREKKTEMYESEEITLMMSKEDDHIRQPEIIKSPVVIEKLRAFFGVNREVQEIKISMTKDELFRKSRNVAKKKFHKRKIVPVTIWDFGGHDVFYITHQTFLTYRAVYMLILDGSRTLNEPCKYERFISSREGSRTQKDYVRFWINTIITYCKGEIPGFPKIMVILTHKDKLNVTEIEQRRNEIFGEITEMFDGSPIKQHLAIEDRIFVNARNSNDPEMDKIKQSLINQARIQPTWGQKLPKCFLPLELEIQYLVREGIALIHIEHLKKINAQQAIRPLTSFELKVFLKFQHSVGKILYFEEPYLDQHIIISPTFIIDAFKSIITHQQFCKGDKQKEKAWYSMNKKGILLKETVEKIWKQKNYAHFYKSMTYLLGVMTYLDFFVEPRRYDSNRQRIPTEFFYVASMVRKQDITGYLQSPTFDHRNIALSFETSSSIIPPALSFRFISYCLSIWGVKTYGDDNEDMLFHRSAVFTIDPSLDVHVQCEDERLIVRLVHARNRALIMRDLASSIRECLFAALHKISQLYIKTSSENTAFIRAFDVKLCCSSSNYPCTTEIEEIGDVWICSRHQIEHGKDLVLAWFTEKEKETKSCESLCPVTDENFLAQTPTDLHLQRLSLEYNMSEVRKLVTALELPYKTWNTLYTSTLADENIKFTALKRCFKRKSFTFKDLSIAAQNEQIQSPHTICKVLRDSHVSFVSDTEPEKWDVIPTDEDIDKLSFLVGGSSLAFLVELGLTFQDWEQIEYSQTERDLVKLNRSIMEAWRNNCKVYNIKPTLRTIGQAFGNIGIDIKNIENLLFN